MRSLLTLLVLTAACTERQPSGIGRKEVTGPTPSAPPLAFGPPPTEPVSAAAIASAPVPACDHPDEVRYGTTCCRRTGSREHRFPDQTVLSCVGGQIGKACRKKGDCDVVCFCPDDGNPPAPEKGPTGPNDGTTGVTGVCGGSLQAGVWMCEIDEKGAVTHVILD
jgi:hypothetical protein